MPFCISSTASSDFYSREDLFKPQSACRRFPAEVETDQETDITVMHVSMQEKELMEQTCPALLLLNDLNESTSILNAETFITFYKQYIRS